MKQSVVKKDLSIPTLIKVIVIPTNEEVMIARDTVKFGEL